MIIVTGATGLVGSHLILELLRSGQAVRALKRATSDLSMIRKVFRVYDDRHKELFDKIEWVEGDIMDIYSLEEAMEGVEKVYHCAAIVSFIPGHRNEMLKVNGEGTANVVNAALQKGVKKLCYASSVAAIGRPEEHDAVIDEKLVWKTSRNNSYYAISKYAAEREVWRGTEEGLDAVIVNPTIIFGLSDPDKAGSQFFTSVWNGLKFYTSGTNGFVDVWDVVKVMIMLMESDIRNERFVICAANLRYRELFDMIARGLNKSAPRYKAGPFLGKMAWRLEVVRSLVSGRDPFITRETARTAMTRSVYSNEKIRKALGFEFIPIEASIEKYCNIFTREFF